jgi:ABC-type amino acid transport substrate-binding protein
MMRLPSSGRGLLLVLLVLSTPCAHAEVLRAAVVPIVNQGRFIETLLADFARERGLIIDVAAVHGREVMSRARRGEVDLVIAHADFRGATRLVEQGVLDPGNVVFANPIALLAPPDDPADAAGAGDPVAALARVRSSGGCLVENDLENLAPLNRDWWGEGGCYLNVGGPRGLPAVLEAVRRGAYVWWGLHPFLMNRQPLRPIVFDDPRLVRPLQVWPVTKGQRTLADAALAYLLRVDTQRAVQAFRLPEAPNVQPWYPAVAADRRRLIRARGHLVVSVKTDGARAADAHRDPAHAAKRGFELRIAQALSDALLGSGRPVEQRIMRRPQRLAAVARGEVDLAIAMIAPSEGARRLVDFSRPYYRDGLAVMQAATGGIEDASALVGKRLLILARDAGGMRQDAARLAEIAGAAMAPRPVENFRAAAEEIRAGRADALLSMAANIDHFLAQHPGELHRSSVLLPVEFAVVVPRGNPALLAAIDDVLGRADATGQLAAWAREAGLRAAP